MNIKKILILDYSTDQSESPAINQWLPENLEVISISITKEKSFPKDLFQKEFSHVVHSGSALSINTDYPFVEQALHFIRNMQEKGVAQFGICYGHQLICRAFLGVKAIRKSPFGLEAGWREVTFTKEGKELLKLEEIETVCQSHFDEVTSMPGGSILIATNSHSAIQAFINKKSKLLGTQFHPEFDKRTGDNQFKGEKKLLSDNNYQLQDILLKQPSFDTGIVFFGLFLNLL